MPVTEATFQETPYGRWITSEGWFVLNLGDAFTVQNEEKGGAAYLIEPREAPFGPNLGATSASSGRASRAPTTTRRTSRRGSSSSPASAC